MEAGDDDDEPSDRTHVAAVAVPAVTPATQVLHYEIVHQLGAGGMGVVYRAVDTRLGRAVALKFLPETVSLQPEAKRRLLLEAQAAANLDHPNVGVIYGIEEADGQLFIVMALYEGQTLEARLADGPVTPREAADWCLQAARGLAKAHDAGIVHRDVKPANLFLTGDGLVKILDFGLVKLETTQGLTVPGTIVGTPEYMAPEQVRGQPADPRADVWALGVVLYEMLTGVSPFRAEGAFAATILRVMSTEPEPLRALVPDVPASFQDVIDGALAKDPDGRLPDMRAFAAALEAATAAAGGTGGRPAPSHPGTQAGTSSPVGSVVGERPSLDGSRSPSMSIMDLTVGAPGSPRVSALLESVPAIGRFIGRARELDELRARLERTHLVGIRGMAGEGKSAVGAHLVRALYPEERICWFTFDPIEKNTADALFWSLAAFLMQADEPLLWKYLQGEIEAHRPLDRTVRLNLFLSSVAATPYAFCFDEVHLVAKDPEIVELFKSLQRSAATGAADGGASFVVMGRDLPADLEHLALTLGGLSAADARALLEARDLHLPGTLFTRLHERTLGNPTLLEIAAAALGRMGDDHGAMAAFVESMAGKSDVRDYVMNHIYDDLESDEKAVLDALSIFPAAVDVDVAEETLAEQGLSGIVRVVASLTQKRIVQETDGGQIYCHDLVREFCYRRLDGKVRRALHGHAANHYRARGRPVKAAHHAFEQGDREGALTLLTEGLRSIIDGGGAASARELFGRFDPHDLSEEQAYALVLAKGEVFAIQGAYREALAVYEDALDDVLEEEGRAELLGRLASVCNELGDHERAILYAGEGLSTCDPDADPAGRARLERALGLAHMRLGRLDEAATSFATGLALAEAAGDAHVAAHLDQFLGVLATRAGRHDEARQRLERSRRAFRAQRDRTSEAAVMGNLAMVYGFLGQHDKELSLLLKVREVFEAVGDVGYLLILYNNLGASEHSAGRHEVALEHFDRLADLARRLDHRAWWSAGLACGAEDLLALGRVDEAYERARQAHDLLADDATASNSVELAISQRVLAEIRLARADPAGAQALFEACIPVFEAMHEDDELAKARQGLEDALSWTASHPSHSQERETTHDPT